MKQLLTLSLALIGGMALAGESSFIKAYDAGQFEDAARQIDGLDLDNAGVARRLGVMYYNAKGVEGDQVKGLELLERAMLAGDATAAVNLAKIYYKVDKNAPKAAWCLMVAESIGDDSVKDDVVKLRGYLGDTYLKGVASYVVQLRDLLANEQIALKNKIEETDRERTSLSKQIAEAQEESKKQKESIERVAAEKSALEIAKSELEAKLTASEKQVADGKAAIDELTAKLEDATKEKSALDKLNDELEDSKKSAATRNEEIEKLKKELEETEAEAKRTSEELVAANKKYQDVFDKYNTLVANSNQKVSSSASALAEAKSAAAAADKKYKEMLAKYNKLVEKYNDLVRKYNAFLKVSKSGTAMLKGIDYDGSEVDVGLDEEMLASLAPSKKSNGGADWFGRGWNTFFCAPCNFVRTISTVGEVYDATSKHTNGGYAFFVSAISTPVVLCCEIVPTFCDFGNGLVDMISLGAYGDWLYSGNLESRWWKRDNTHFPWIDKK